ncbi:MAG: hypothetical protein KJO39_06655 [Bacteroidia bacterium]|nr:hypothetical protein [Bacteroidia bacterium]NNF31116.1 hypothetical protein [Flavobacteriaceae bacterium]NNJ81518.1 hypothetical protein [Flavobacteriaceae bacterium]NNK55578.1 hypothetical protein [Flavobacteriaceae bacterium]NNM08868.1 hypothetical protein [Flavobacteriaceae bacterium]
MRKVILILSILCIGLISIAGIRSSEEGPKITICHIPPGNPENAHSITISINALPAHLAHGDSEGACEAQCTLETDPECYCELFPNDPACN